ncbi:hypothetical protein [Streptomyces cinerochromogenes]|uniref:hypothetical protein n=1 Tax=Streptomyces cinerochromogenes TaxID=66422 RepID=UPI0033AC0E51
MDPVGRGPDGAQLVAEPPLGGVDVGHRQGGALGGEQPGKARADPARTGHGRPASVQPLGAVQPPPAAGRLARPEAGVRPSSEERGGRHRRAEDLLLLLYGRRSYQEPAFAVSGDATVLDRWFSHPAF